jgi:hypothetical protein
LRSKLRGTLHVDLLDLEVKAAVNLDVRRVKILIVKKAVIEQPVGKATRAIVNKRRIPI